MKVYEDFWTHLLQAEATELSKIFDADFKQFGTTEAEAFYNKEQVLDFVNKTATQVIDNIQIKNRVIKTEAVGELFLVIEQSDIYVKTDDNWVFYSKCRASTLLQKKDNTWKLIQQHISLPDAKTQEGETIAFEKISKENLELREAVKRRTIELEHTNRELAIEAAVERVRAQSMAMYKTSDLYKVNEEIFSQLNKLKVDGLTGVSIYLVDESDVVTVWDLSSPGNISKPGSYSLKYDSKNYPVLGGWVDTWKTSAEDYFVLDFPKEKLELAVEELREILPEMALHFSNAIESGKLQHQWSPAGRLSDGLLALDLVTPPTEDTKSIVSKMAGAFNLAYQRFLDLQKAEAQAREAKIEAALERVRSRSLAMHNTSELQDVVNIVAQQLHQINIDINGGVFITINDEVGEHFSIWASQGAADYVQKVIVPPIVEPFFKMLIEAIRHKKDFYLEQLSHEEKLWLFQHMFNYPPWSELTQEKKNELLSREGGLCRSVAISQHTSISITDHYGKKFSDEENEVLKRFGKVLEQAYTRFLDLQKAEVQAKEARIELSLERIRSQATAMRVSTDLLDIVVTMRREFLALGHEAHYFWYMRWLPGKYEKAMTSGDGTRIGMVMELPRHMHGDIKQLADWEKSDEPAVVFAMDVEVAVDYIDKMIKLGDFKLVDHNAPTLDDIRHIGGLTFVMARTMHGEIGYSLPGVVNEPPAEDISTLVKFANVFDLAYRRFEDLKTTEYQNRETQIELALERTRTQSMQMQHSTELDDTLRVFHEQVLFLGIESAFSYLWLPDEDRSRHIFWAAWAENATGIELVDPGAKVFKSKAIDYPLDRTEPATAQCLIDWKSDEPVHTYHIPAEGVENYFAAWKELLHGVEELKPEHFSGGLYYVEAFMKYGCFGVLSENDLPEDQKKILYRFTIEFERTYTRFLDLQKAEAQAREAKIEAALERVRSRTMAMQRSEELLEVATILFQQVKALGVPQWNCGFNIWEIGDKEFTYYPGSPDGIISPSPCKIPLNVHPVFQRFEESRKRGDDLFIYEKQGEEQADHYRYMLSLPGVGDLLQNMLDAGFELPSFQIDHLANFAYGNLIFITYEHFPQMHDVFKRFAKVFEQTYTRFLDLQKAEASAREAKIEAALEKVRSRTMAMQKEGDLLKVIESFGDQLSLLGLRIDTACFNNGVTKRDWDLWIYSPSLEIPYPPQRRFVSYKDVAYFEQTVKNIEAYERTGEELHDKFFTKAQKDEFTEHYFEENPVEDEVKSLIFAAPGSTVIDAFLEIVTVSILKYETEPFTKEEHDIFRRFAYAFKQAYTRFLDLQKAEAQAKEAKIEAALEKVRSRTMAMQQSNELGAVASVLFKEMNRLVTNLWTCGFVLCEKERGEDEWWLSMDMDFTRGFFLPNMGDFAHATLYEGWNNGENFRAVQLEGDVLQEHYRWLMSIDVSRKIFEEMDAAGLERPVWQKLHAAYFSKGYLVLITREPCGEEEIFKRFAQVFDLTYTRFLDLQKAEARAREAKIESVVERVRAKALVMHTSEEILEVVATLKNELVALEPNVSGATIYLKQEDGNLRMWDLSSVVEVEGEFQLTLDIVFNLDETHPDLFIRRVWNATEKYYVIRQDEEDLVRTMDWLRQYKPREAENVMAFIKSNGLKQLIHPTVQIANGRLSVDFLDNVPTDMESILIKMGAAFDLAYKRFLDLQHAEEQALEIRQEKERLELTLRDLKATQAQLIQSEKMASLGELTAGIAHEIQNPLNFVNNFSEVNVELIAELEEEVKAGNTEEVLAIASDLNNNLQKITHHGKRADAIVRSMLQHSQKSSGQKDEIDINALADEYLRLSYHGLRAKDKSFNAIMETHFDPSVGRMNVAGADIGRVLLNLFNNAFYAVSEKKKMAYEDYEPTVQVTTTKSINGVEIKVKDNGTGIPEKALEKIYQPFFTTKPTGEGTGLGLSLSYDIITKGHGGELKVETKEGEGSTFSIQLPLH